MACLKSMDSTQSMDRIHRVTNLQPNDQCQPNDAIKCHRAKEVQNGILQRPEQSQNGPKTHVIFAVFSQHLFVLYDLHRHIARDDPHKNVGHDLEHHVERGADDPADKTKQTHSCLGEITMSDRRCTCSGSATVDKWRGTKLKDDC